MRTWLRNKIKGLLPDIDFDVLIPPDSAMGDYSTNAAFILATHPSRKDTEGKEKGSPMKVGEELVEELSKDKELANAFERIEVAKPGFLNFYLKREFLQRQLVEIYKKRDSFGKSNLCKGKTVIVEYGGTNIAKPMHVGHLRSTIIGDGLANVYGFLGYKVIRWNYIGDWGTQFGKLIAAWKRWGDKKKLIANPIIALLELYVAFHHNLGSDPSLENEGREEFKKLEEGDSENRKLWEMFRQYSLDDFNKIFRQLDIKFDITKGESGYESRINETVGFIKEKGVLKKSEGADIVELEGLPPALIVKSDGTSLYITRDIASLKERVEKYHPEKVLYVVANQQALHFEQLFAVWRMTNPDVTDLVHVKFGMVLGEDGKKLATREGKIIPLQELIDKIVALALDVVKKKTPELPEEQARTIAKVVGVGALKYNDLKQHPHTDIVFDWRAMLDISGNSGPYLQYTYARLVNIIAKAKDKKDGDASLLIQPEEEKLMKRLLEFPDVITGCTESNTLNGLALYLYELSSDANRFYESVRVLDDENLERPADAKALAGKRGARLVLISAVSSVLKTGLELLGIEVLERI